MVIGVYKSQQAMEYRDYVYTFKAPKEEPPEFRMANECYWNIDVGLEDKELKGKSLGDALSSYSSKNRMKKNISL